MLSPLLGGRAVHPSDVVLALAAASFLLAGLSILLLAA